MSRFWASIICFIVLSLGKDVVAKELNYNCVDCNGAKPTMDSARPDKKPIKELMAKTVEPVQIASGQASIALTKDIKKPFEIYADRYCDRFHSADKDNLDILFDDMEASPYPDVFRYLSYPTCQPRAYGNDNKIPIIHLVADDPDKRLKFLEITYTYFEFYENVTKFTELLNAKSKPMNETFLDYMETLDRKNYHKTPALQAQLKTIKEYACSHGAIYNLYKDKKCP